MPNPDDFTPMPHVGHLTFEAAQEMDTAHRRLMARAGLPHVSAAVRSLLAGSIDPKPALEGDRHLAIGDLRCVYPDHDPRILKAMADRPGTMTTQRSVYETLPGRDSHVRQVYLHPDREQNGSYTLDGTFLTWDEPATDDPTRSDP